jgi:peroxiredoxin
MWMLWLALGLTWAVIAFMVWLQFQIMRQSGATLSRLETVERAALDSEPDGSVRSVGSIRSVGSDRSDEEPLTEYHGLSVGADAPDFELPDLSGGRHALSEFRGKPLLIVFFSPRCGYCTEIAADLAAMPADGKGGGPVPLILTNGTVAENREWIEEYGVRCTVLLQKGMEVANKYNATGTPMGYLVDSEGKIASKMAVGGSSIVDLIPTFPLRRV